MDGQGHVKLTDFGLATGQLDPKRIESLRIKLDHVKNNEIVHRSTLERRSMFASMREANPRFVRGPVTAFFLSLYTFDVSIRASLTPYSIGRFDRWLTGLHGP